MEVLRQDLNILGFGNFQHLFPYFHHIKKNMYIFVVRFLLISVMKLVEGAIYYLIEYMCIISLFLKLATFVRRDDSTDTPR